MKALIIFELVTSSEYRHSGGGANSLCMPSDPQYILQYRGGTSLLQLLETLKLAD